MGFLSNLLKTLSGSNDLKVSEQLLFDKVIGFRGIVPGVGTSTIVQNVAIALSAHTNYSVCVLDTHYLYPTLYPMLVQGVETKRKDYLEFNGDISEVVVSTAYKNISLVSMSNRTIVDMLSSKDSPLLVDKLIGALKSYFDVVLVDLSYEPTNMYAHFAVKCNRIFNVADYSLKCVYNLRKSLNMMSTSAVPFAKADRVIINRVLPDMLTDINGVMTEAGLKIVGEIPYSLTLAKLGLAGKRIWSTSTSNKDIFAFSSVIDKVVESIITVTPINKEYINKTPYKDFPSEDPNEGSNPATLRPTETIEDPTTSKGINETETDEPTPQDETEKPKKVKKEKKASGFFRRGKEGKATTTPNSGVAEKEELPDSEDTISEANLDLLEEEEKKDTKPDFYEDEDLEE